MANPLRARIARITRAGVAVILLAGIAVLSTAQLVVWAVTQRFYSGQTDEISGYERRLAGLRRMLPRRGVVSYVSDQPDSDKERYLTQYALAPLLLDLAPQHGLGVGNFFDPASGPALVAAGPFEVLRDLGEGVMLLRRSRDLGEGVMLLRRSRDLGEGVMLLRPSR